MLLYIFFSFFHIGIAFYFPPPPPPPPNWISLFYVEGELGTIVICIFYYKPVLQHTVLEVYEVHKLGNLIIK